MNEPRFVNTDEIEIDGYQITIDGPGNYERYKDADDVLFMAKGPGQVQAYVDLARTVETSGARIQKALEVGFFRGGSAVFLDRLFELESLVCVDQAAVLPPLLGQYRDEHPAVHVHLDVQQADLAMMREICEREFPDGLDLVVDDASHFYEETKATFEVTFPFLRPGGLFVLEDWPWAHQPAQQDLEDPWAGRSALTNLLFELLVAHGTDSQVVAELHLVLGLAWFTRGPAPLPRDGSFRLEDYRLVRGRELPVL